MKKLLSIIFAILMIVTTVPFVFAAEDGFVEVSTEAEMLVALENGGNIMLTGDITVSDEYWCGYEITKNTTIDLNGHTITGEHVFTPNHENAGVVLTIFGNGTFKATDPNNDMPVDVWGTLNLLGGTIEGYTNVFGTINMYGGWVDELHTDKLNSDDDTSHITGGYVKALNCWGGIVTISGGHVEALGIKYGTIIISGGTFGFNPTAYLAEGYTATEANGIWVVTCADGCNFSYTDNEDGTHIGNCTKCGYEVIEEHTLETVEAKAPTCTEIGWDAYEYCTACDYTTYVEKEALNHKDTLVQVEAKAPTCTEIGWDAYEYCTACTYTTYVEIPENGHTALDAVRENEVASKCGLAGSYDLVVYCACGEELDRDKFTVEALKHSFTKYEVTEEAKCGVEGKEVAYCDNGCGETDEKAIDALTHKDADGDYKCDNGCGHEFEKPAPEEPTPDTPDEPNTPDEPYTPDEPTDSTCDHLCHKSGFIGFIWKIVQFFSKLFKINPVCECGAAHY